MAETPGIRDSHLIETPRPNEYHCDVNSSGADRNANNSTNNVENYIPRMLVAPVVMLA